MNKEQTVKLLTDAGIKFREGTGFDGFHYDTIIFDGHEKGFQAATFLEKHGSGTIILSFHGRESMIKFY